MKQFLSRLFTIAACLCAAAAAAETGYKPQTVRQTPQYLSTDPAEVEDTCPGHDILKRFDCTKNNLPGYSCFDVYMVQGDPVDAERYTLLDQTVTAEPGTAEPRCTFEGEMTCDNFLKELNYNLDFSWFITNFPSSSFPQCGETYSCTRIACLKPAADAPDGSPRAQKLSCVFKKNQIFFLGAQITCRDKNAAPKTPGPQKP